MEREEREREEREQRESKERVSRSFLDRIPLSLFLQAICLVSFIFPRHATPREAPSRAVNQRLLSENGLWQVHGRQERQAPGSVRRAARREEAASGRAERAIGFVVVDDIVRNLRGRRHPRQRPNGAPHAGALYRERRGEAPFRSA